MARIRLFAGLLSLAAFGAIAPATAQTVTLVYANGYARTHIQVGVVADEWIKRIDAATNGRVKIRHVPGGTLLKPENMVEGIRGGVADIGSTVVSFFPGQLPISATLAGTVDINYGNKLDLKGVTAVFVTHRMRDAFTLASQYAVTDNGSVEFHNEGQTLCIANTRFLMLRDGKVIFEGPDELIRRSTDEYIKRFLA